MTRNQTSAAGNTEMMNFRLDHAAHVAQVLTDEQVTITEVATLTGIPEHVIQNRLTGNSPFTVDELVLLSQTLGVQTSDLLPPSAFVS